MSETLRNAFDEIRDAFLATTQEFAVNNLRGTREDAERWGGEFFETLHDAAAEPDEANRDRLMDAAWALVDQLEEAGRLRVTADGMRRLKEFGSFAVRVLFKLIV